ncbi:MAG: hypothetical protein DRI69_01025 [Bacteroidetes bacterium]|nr:MAG: hypothetical protein DRI69_01025 [Bacteroidota bacterium]
MKKCTLLVLVALLCSFGSSAQNALFKFYNTESGLSSNRIWDFAQDTQGLIWIQSGGINRFDGHHFVNHLNNDASIFKNRSAANNILNINSDIYFFEGNSIVSFNTITEEQTFFPLDSFVSSGGRVLHSLAYNYMNDAILIVIFNGDDNNISFLQFRDGITRRIATVDDISVHYKDETGSIYSDSSGNIYFPNKQTNAIHTINPAGRQTHSYPIVSGSDIYRLKSGSSGELYMSAEDKLYVLNNQSESFELHPFSKSSNVLPNDVISSYIETNNGDLWVGYEKGSLLYYHAKQNLVYDYTSEIKKRIPYRVTLSGMFQDRGGSIWINTMLGLIKVTPQRNLFDTYYTDKSETCGGYCSFRGMTEDSNGYIYASFYNGIFRIDPVTGIATHGFPDIEFTPFDLAYKNHHILLNNGKRIDIRTGKLDNNYKAPPFGNLDVGIFTSDNRGNLWWAYKKELYTLSENSGMGQWVRLSKFSHDISGLKYDIINQNLWLASEGLINYNLADGKIQYIGQEVLGSVVVIRYIYPDGNGKVWLATDVNGLLMYDPKTDHVESYTTDNGLCNNNVCGILPEGDSCLWLSTESGLSRFHIASETFVNFYEGDGLANNEFNRRSLFKSAKGQFFFGGMSGVSVFYPEDVMQEYGQTKTQGELVLTSFTKTDNNVDSLITDYFHAIEPTVDIYHYNTSVSFEYVLTDYTNPGNIRYSYNLEGHDIVWSRPTKFNTASFNDLPIGDYILNVKALDDKGGWSSDQLKVHIIVHAPWWKTSWAYTFYVICLIALLTGLYWFTARRIKLKHQLLFEKEETTRLKDLDTFKSRLFTNLTHEFRTPLTVILGMSEQIQKAPKEHLAEGMQLIQRNGRSMLRLINQLLDLSKLDNNSLKIDYRNGDIIPFLHYVTASFQSYANQQNLSLRFRTEISQVSMDHDPELLQQVLTNLISNALKFTPSGGEVWVKVRKTVGGRGAEKRDVLRRESARGATQRNDMERLEIEISDTGIGIPEEDLVHIFDRFYQADNSSTRAREGSGIGLAHAKELVELMQGSIEMSSEIEKGTQVLVSLPVTQVASENLSDYQPLDESELMTMANGTVVTPNLTNGQNSDLPHLLIIEDNPDVVSYLKSCLKNDYQLDIAYNGRIGIEKALEDIPDLIISDVMMPEKDGYEVCDFLKNDERTSHIPIILLTAKADSASKITGLRQGSDAYLSKPFDVTELLVRLENLNDLRRKMKEKYKGVLLQTAPEEVTKSIHPKEAAFIKKVTDILEGNYAREEFSLPDFCKAIGMSRPQLFRKLKALTGTSPSSFIRSFRLQKARLLLESTDINVNEVAFHTGFKDPSYFSKVFQEEFSVKPSALSK